MVLALKLAEIEAVVAETEVVAAQVLWASSAAPMALERSASEICGYSLL